jgi:hypothetical protein
MAWWTHQLGRSIALCQCLSYFGSSWIQLTSSTSSSLVSSSSSSSPMLTSCIVVASVALPLPLSKEVASGAAALPSWVGFVELLVEDMLIDSSEYD